MDPAVQRAGRFGRHFYVTLPNATQRYLILKSLVRDITIPIDPTVDLRAIAERCENFSGADLKALVNEAAFAAYSDTNSTSKRTIKVVSFEQGFVKLKPSLTNQVSIFEVKINVSFFLYNRKEDYFLIRSSFFLQQRREYEGIYETFQAAN